MGKLTPKNWRPVPVHKGNRGGTTPRYAFPPRGGSVLLPAPKALGGQLVHDRETKRNGYIEKGDWESPGPLLKTLYWSDGTRSLYDRASGRMHEVERALKGSPKCT